MSVFGLLLISCACVLFRKIDLRFYTHPPYILDFITGPDTISMLLLLTAFFLYDRPLRCLLEWSSIIGGTSLPAFYFIDMIVYINKLDSPCAES